MPERRLGVGRILWVGGLVLLLVLASGTLAGTARGASTATLPVSMGSRFVGNLSSPGLVAGASGPLSLTLSNPLVTAMGAVLLTLQVYAFNAFPGNATSTLPLSSPPLLATSSGTGLRANFTYSSIPSGSRLSLSADVVTSSTTPLGAYAVRTSLSFLGPNGTAYHLASRGWFSQALWEQATEGPNGTTVLSNQSLTILNVSGVLAETSIQVTSTSLNVALYVLLGIVFVLVGVGAYFYFARSAHSSSGAR